MRRCLVLVAIAALGCQDGGSSADAGFPYPAWEPTLPEAVVMGVRRGFTPARGIVHLHSPYSHDACDNRPRAADGTIDETCYQDLRRGLCATAMDFAALTDHDDSMADEEWLTLFLTRGEDRLVYDLAGSPIASRLVCEDGREILLFVGGENDLMPVMMDRHPAGDAPTRHGVYNANDPEAVAAYRSLGGLAWVAHTESKDLQLLRDLKLDGIEIYNLHAAIDPDIRSAWLGLPANDAIMAVFQFAGQADDGPEPDLALLSFLAENTPSVAKWDTLLGEGNRVVGTGGTDAHQNALPLLLRDRERGDSYRRMMRWFANVVLVEDPYDPAEIELALSRGRTFLAFEILGTPEGFDVRAELGDGTVAELGAEVRVVDGPKLRVVTPKVYALDARLPAPEIRTRILRVDSGGSVEVAAGTAEVAFDATAPGAYRVEVLMRPRHLRPYLGTLAAEHDYSAAEYVWIYASPIYVRP